MHILAQKFLGNPLRVCSESGSAIVLTPARTPHRRHSSWREFPRPAASSEPDAQSRVAVMPTIQPLLSRSVLRVDDGETKTQRDV
jgi:hypothetical protein